MTDLFYRAFEDKYRGSRELIKSRLEVYLPFVEPLLKGVTQENVQAVDLGCGRGEWVELLAARGYFARGVDIDDGMLQACLELDLNVENADALSHLQSLDPDSVSVISGFHIAEHLPFEQLKDLVEQALKVLRPGGLLILETPNPENIVVGTASFYLDPSHERPLPPLLLSFLAENAGFERVKVLRLQEPDGVIDSQALSLLDVLSGVSPDYSIVAQKNAANEMLQEFDSLFAKEYGLSLHALATSYGLQVDAEFNNIRSQVSEEFLRNGELSDQILNAHKKAAAVEALNEKSALTIESMKEKLSSARQDNIDTTKELSSVREESAAMQGAQKNLQDMVGGLEDRLNKVFENGSETQKQLVDKLEAERDQYKDLLKDLSNVREESAVTTAAKENLQKVVRDLEDKLTSVTDSGIETQKQLADKLETERGQYKLLSEEFDLLKVRENTLNQSNHQWWSIADQTGAELQAVYRSMSWRVTWPLRKITQAFRWIFSYPIKVVVWFVCLPKRLAVRFTHRDRPSAQIEHVENNDLNLSVETSMSLDNAPVAEELEEIKVLDGLESLSPHAKDIYWRLKNVNDGN